MPNPAILDSVRRAWSGDPARGKMALDLSAGSGDTSQILAAQGYVVVATDYGRPRPMANDIGRVGGVDLNEFLPFRSIREIRRVLKPGGRVLISTPNILNVFSRIRFLFTGFLRGRVRPVHYSRKPGRAPNIYLIHFYELYYLLFHYGFELVELRKTRVKFAQIFFTGLLYPFMRLFSMETVIRAEKDPVQRRLNWQILKLMFHPALLLSDNIVVMARKIEADENRSRP